MRVKSYSAGRGQQLWLVQDSFAGMFSETYKIMPVFWFESDLNQGRFHIYQPRRQRFIVQKELPFNHAATEQKVEWIADNIEAAWSISAFDNLEQGRVELHYSFANQRDAALFMMLYD